MHARTTGRVIETIPTSFRMSGPKHPQSISRPLAIALPCATTKEQNTAVLTMAGTGLRASMTIKAPAISISHGRLNETQGRTDTGTMLYPATCTYSIMWFFRCSHAPKTITQPIHTSTALAQKLARQYARLIIVAPISIPARKNDNVLESSAQKQTCHII
jgi:hypothetical protein